MIQVDFDITAEATVAAAEAVTTVEEEAAATTEEVKLTSWSTVRELILM